MSKRAIDAIPNFLAGVVRHRFVDDQSLRDAFKREVKLRA
jgi:hypothetical protein